MYIMTSVHTVIVHKATEQQTLEPKGRKRSSQLLPALMTTNLVAGPLVVPVVVPFCGDKAYRLRH